MTIQNQCRQSRAVNEKVAFNINEKRWWLHVKGIDMTKIRNFHFYQCPLLTAIQPYLVSGSMINALVSDFICTTVLGSCERR